MDSNTKIHIKINKNIEFIEKPCETNISQL